MSHIADSNISETQIKVNATAHLICKSRVYILFYIKIYQVYHEINVI